MPLWAGRCNTHGMRYLDAVRCWILQFIPQALLVLVWCVALAFAHDVGLYAQWWAQLCAVDTGVCRVQNLVRTVLKMMLHDDESHY